MMKWRKQTRCLAMLALMLGAGASAGAQETATYSYDAKGRLQKVQRSGGPASGTTTTYAYDNADNRSQVTITNSPNGGGGNDGGSGATVQSFRFVVLPISGFTVIRGPG